MAPGVSVPTAAVGANEPKDGCPMEPRVEAPVDVEGFPNVNIEREDEVFNDKRVSAFPKTNG